MKVFEGLKFKRVSSPIHRLDPRTKFIVSCVIFAQAFLFTELLYLIILFMAQIPLVLLARVHKQWTRSLRGSLILTLLIFFINLHEPSLCGSHDILLPLLSHHIPRRSGLSIGAESRTLRILLRLHDSSSIRSRPREGSANNNGRPEIAGAGVRERRVHEENQKLHSHPYSLNCQFDTAKP
jgi:energy-coupling factor transporter transmembrane protein EcfT